MDDKQNAITELNIKKLKDKQGDSVNKQTNN